MSRRKVLKNFVALEGIDGAGTTTQLEKVAAACKNADIPCYATCEPTIMETGRLIRKILSGELPVNPGTLARMFVADRYEHIYGKDGIIARLDSGDLVVSDRYLFSSLAYQSVDCGFEEVSTLNEGFPLPELLVYLDIPVEVGDFRASGRKTREIFEYSDFQHRVRNMYERAIQSHENLGMEILRIDGTLSQDEVFEKLWSRLRRIPIENM